MTDATGVIASGGRYNYDAYGVQLGAQSSVVSPAATSLLYTGEQFDTGLQQYYLRARYYNQNTGRFNQLDAFAGLNYDPQSLHKYCYVHDDPVTGVDPTGQFSLIELLVVVAIILILYVGISWYNVGSDSPPSQTQTTKLNQARALLASSNLPAQLGSDAREAASEAYDARVRVYKSGANLYVLPVAKTRSWFSFVWFDTIHVGDKAFDLDVRFLASLLIHEGQHLDQWLPMLPEHSVEKPAYQIQSDYLRAIGIQGSLAVLLTQFPNQRDKEFLQIHAYRFKHHEISNPAITVP